MKRRKTLNKYTVGDHGQITNNNPVLSPRTQKLLEMLTFAELMKDYSSGQFGLDYDEQEIVDTDCGDEKPSIEQCSDDVVEEGCVVDESTCDQV